jgi:hypothetical protein
MEFFVFWIVIAFIVAWWAKSWGRSYGNYLVCSLLLSPLIASLVLLIKGQNQSGTPTQRVCPSCAELVKREAVKCRFCGEAL